MQKINKLKEIKIYLENYVKSRESKNRHKVLVARARRKYNIDNNFSDLLIKNIIIDALSDNRLINRVQQDNPKLRGSDYKNKTNQILQEQKQIDLGYGFEKMERSKLKTLYEK